MNPNTLIDWGLTLCLAVIMAVLLGGQSGPERPHTSTLTKIREFEVVAKVMDAGGAVPE